MRRCFLTHKPEKFSEKCAFSNGFPGLAESFDTVMLKISPAYDNVSFNGWGKKVWWMCGAWSQTSPGALVFATWKDSLWLEECGSDERVPSFNYTLTFTLQLSKTTEKFSQGIRKLLGIIHSVDLVIFLRVA